MHGADFPLTLYIKAAMLKTFSLFMFKILLDVNNSLVCSNLLLLKMIIDFFQVCSASAPSRGAAIIYVTVNIRIVK